MNITLLSNRDLASNYALNHLLPALHGHQLTVFLSSRVGKADGLPQGLRDLKFMEQTLFNQLLTPLLTRPLPHPPGNSHAAAAPDVASTLLPFDALGLHLMAPVSELNDINSPAGLARLRASAPDLIISLRYGVILRAAAISVPTHGVINLHSGLLPAYRGVMASFWGLLNGESQLGTTLHYIHDAGIDTGSIIGTTTLPVKPGHSYLWHVLNLYPPACALVAATVARMAADERIAPYPQPPGGSYYSFPAEADLARFAERGLVLFDGDELLAFLQRYLSPE